MGVSSISIPVCVPSQNKTLTTGLESCLNQQLMCCRTSTIYGRFVPTPPTQGVGNCSDVQRCRKLRQEPFHYGGFRQGAGKNQSVRINEHDGDPDRLSENLDQLVRPTRGVSLFNEGQNCRNRDRKPTLLESTQLSEPIRDRTST